MKNNKLNKNNYSTADYFNIRAPRYANSIKTFPFARSLDLIPYCFAIKDLGTNLNFLDAFCGPGFISSSLSNLNHKFVLADVSDEMIKSSSTNHESFVVKNDFENLLNKYGKGYFNIIVSHGGFHHAVSLVNNKIDNNKTIEKHRNIISNLSKLLSKDGILIIADIPNDNYIEDYLLSDKHYSLSQFKDIVSSKSLQLISDSLKISLDKAYSLIQFQNIIKSKVPNQNPHPVPRYYFDEYIAKRTKYGHIAMYPDFIDIKSQFEKYGIKNIGLFNYHSPWIFESNNAAGWFFKEKFSIDRPTLPNENSELDYMMYEIINQYLGVNNYNDFSFVNWGVTYSIFKKYE
ncbi:MAG: class I SAM-dependent methyltransferase [Bacteroidales bacterium]|nr:class I SAM-dependent methyltransferase [Bacteroidales bacterium]